MPRRPVDKLEEGSFTYRAVKIRIHLSGEQEALVVAWQHGLRHLWNHSLVWCRHQRKTTQKWPNLKAITDHMLDVKRREKPTPFLPLREIPAHAILILADDLHKAISAWLKSISASKDGKKSAYPRRSPQIRGNKRLPSVYAVGQSTTFDATAVRLPKLGSVSYSSGFMPRLPLNGRLMSSRIYEKGGSWYLASVFKTPKPENTRTPVVEKIALDVDPSREDFVRIDQEGSGVAHRAFAGLNTNTTKFARLNRALSRRKSGSRRHLKSKLALQRMHEKIANQRADYLHKLSRDIVNTAASIDVRMSEPVLAAVKRTNDTEAHRRIYDAASRKFIQLLQYKSEDMGRTFSLATTRE